MVGVALDPAERMEVWAIGVVSKPENCHSSPAGLLQRCPFIYLFLLLWGILKKIKTANKLGNAGIFWLNPSVTCAVTVGCLLCYFRPFSHAFCDIFMLER